MDRAPLFSTALRILFFSADRETLLKLDGRHTALGLVATWLVGMGRYWDDPGAHLLQHLGVGSVIYVFALTTLLWLVTWPLRPQDNSWHRLLTYVALTSPPAMLYAIPVEWWVSMPVARGLNAWFLAIVALWRVALLLLYLRRVARLHPVVVVIGALVPLMGIVVVLTALNLERAVFDFMGGFRDGTANDSAYAVLVTLTLFSVLGFLPVLIAYIVSIVLAWKRPS